MVQKAIRSTRVLTPNGLVPATVLIGNGRIEEVITSSIALDVPLFDIGDEVLMPGLIDPHVHINEPGRTEWEGFTTATQAAIAGGVTMLVDMPLNSSPVTTTVGSLDKKINAANSQLSAHCGFWGGIVPGNMREIEGLAARGVMGFKAFLTHSGIDEFPNVTEEDLRKAMPLIAQLGLPLLVHCELKENEHDTTEGIGGSYLRYLTSRPGKWEQDAIELMVRLCEETGCRVHIVHLSSARALDTIARAKQKGLPLTVETAQHYLYFTSERIGEGQTLFKCAPPVRDRANNEALWLALKDGLIDFVATDHSPAPPDMKHLETGDFGRAWGGIASIQFALPALWTKARQHGCSIEDISRWLSTGPAQLLQLDHRKGKIEMGYDADLVAWNPEAQFVVRPEMILHRHKISPYTGEELYGVVTRTILRGDIVFENGNFHDTKGEIMLKR